MRAQRMLRVNELLKREIADLLERIDFPIHGAIVSVSEVVSTPDLRHAKVHMSILGANEPLQKDIIRFLRGKRPFLQKQISKDITLKYTPVLSFDLDSRIEEGDKVLAIISEIEDQASKN
ncbi:MAG: 30S ribosome-binding factor RbfA [Victivallales bacterium]|nr:30S ribosome-binding factor RbfA [Victivallales bacterium]